MRYAAGQWYEPDASWLWSNGDQAPDGQSRAAATLLYGLLRDFGPGALVEVRLIGDEPTELRALHSGAAIHRLLLEDVRVVAGEHRAQVHEPGTWAGPSHLPCRLVTAARVLDSPDPPGDGGVGVREPRRPSPGGRCATTALDPFRPTA